MGDGSINIETTTMLTGNPMTNLNIQIMTMKNNSGLGEKKMMKKMNMIGFMAPMQHMMNKPRNRRNKSLNQSKSSKK